MGLHVKFNATLKYKKYHKVVGDRMMGGQLQINSSTFYQGVYICVYAVIIIRYGLTDWGSLTLELMSWFSGLITITIIGCAGLRLRSIARSSFLTLVWKKCFLLQPSFLRLHKIDQSNEVTTSRILDIQEFKAVKS